MLSESVYSLPICPKLRRSGREVTNTECARIYGDVARAHFFCTTLDRRVDLCCRTLVAGWAGNTVSQMWRRAKILAVATGRYWPF